MKQSQQKKAVCQGLVPGPQGPEKAIDQAQAYPQEKGQAQLLQGQSRGRHPRNRLSQPPGARGSS